MENLKLKIAISKRTRRFCCRRCIIAFLVLILSQCASAQIIYDAIINGRYLPPAFSPAAYNPPPFRLPIALSPPPVIASPLPPGAPPFPPLPPSTLPLPPPTSPPPLTPLPLPPPPIAPTLTTPCIPISCTYSIDLPPPPMAFLSAALAPPLSPSALPPAAPPPRPPPPPPPPLVDYSAPPPYASANPSALAFSLGGYPPPPSYSAPPFGPVGVPPPVPGAGFPSGPGAYPVAGNPYAAGIPFLGDPTFSASGFSPLSDFPGAGGPGEVAVGSGEFAAPFEGPAGFARPLLGDPRGFVGGPGGFVGSPGGPPPGLVGFTGVPPGGPGDFAGIFPGVPGGFPPDGAKPDVLNSYSQFTEGGIYPPPPVSSDYPPLADGASIPPPLPTLPCAPPPVSNAYLAAASYAPPSSAAYASPAPCLPPLAYSPPPSAYYATAPYPPLAYGSRKQRQDNAKLENENKTTNITAGGGGDLSSVRFVLNKPLKELSPPSSPLIQQPR